MNYTKSLDYIIHLLTGQRRHEDAQALPTVVSDTDVDAPIWEILEVVKAAGIMPKDFDYDDVTSYNQLYTALMKHIGSSPVTTYTATAGAALAVTLTKAQCGVVVVDAALNAVNLTLDVSNITAAACNDKQTYRWIFKRGDTSTKAVNVILPAYKKLIKTGQMSAASASTISVPLTAALDIVYDPQTNTFIENETVPMVTGTTTGTAAAYTVTTTPTFDAATAQTRAQLIIHTGNANAGVASTIDINGTGAKPFKQSDSTGALVNAVTFAGQIVDVVSNGTAWVMLDAVYQASDAGLIAFFASNSAPTGYLKANGAAISRASYATLFTAIGTTFGAGNGSTTFNLPDLRGEFIRGWDDGRGTDAARIFGSSQVSQNLSHDHGLKTEAGTPGYGELVFPDYPSSPWVERQLGNANDYAYAGFRVATFASGGNESRPRNIALLACIKY